MRDEGSAEVEWGGGEECPKTWPMNDGKKTERGVVENESRGRPLKRVGEGCAEGESEAAVGVLLKEA
jgi:hypothetical protein